MVWLLKKIWYKTKISFLKVILKFLKVESPKLLEGKGTLLELPERINKEGVDNILLVTDINLMRLGLLDSLMEKLQEEKIQYHIFQEVKPNPTIECVEEAKKLYLDKKCKGILAFGGGSVMDCAKVAGARVNNPNKPVKKMRGNLKLRNSIPPMYAVPTTSGTGSEATLAAVITDSKTHEKFAINDPKLVPKIAVLDPELTLKLPGSITSTTGMDALTHAVEAYIGTAGTEFTNERAVKAVNIIFDNIYGAYQQGENEEYRLNMAKASYYAGEAFTRAFVGYVHAIAHNLGGMYGVPHGLANAVVMPYILDYFGDSIEEKLSQLAVAAGLGREGEEKGILTERFIKFVKDLNKKMGIPSKIEQLKREDIPLIAERALKEANGNYPVPKIMNLEECMEILRELI